MNLGFNLDLRDKSVIEQELRRRVEIIEAEADFNTWLKEKEKEKEKEHERTTY